MMGDEHVFNVDWNQLRAHGDTVETLGGDLAATRSIAASGAVRPDAYGWLCQFLSPKLDSTSQWGVRALHESTRALADVARHLRSAAVSFHHADTADASAAISARRG